MNQNVLIGIVVLLVVLAGGYYLLTMNPSLGGSTATSTVTTTQDTTTTTNTATAAAPSVVTNASVAPTNSTAVVTGTVTPNGAQTTYWYEYGTSANLGSKTAVQIIGSSFTAIPSPGYITGLSTSALYYFRLTAQNSFGTVSGATYSFSTNNNPPGQGTAPGATTHSATNITRTGATLRANVNPHSSETTYWFEYGDTANFGQVTAFQSAGSANASAAVSAAVSGLAPQTKYFFRVNAQNQYGTVNGATQSFTTTGPAVPAAVPVVTTQVASNVATTTVTLRGTVNPSSAQTTYWFEYGTDSSFASASLKSTPHKSAGGAAATVSVESNVAGLKAATTYYYRTVAENSGGTVRGLSEAFITK